MTVCYFKFLLIHLIQAQIDENYSKFDAGSVVVEDESAFIWGAAPYRTIAKSDGTGAYVKVGDKFQNMRTSLVLAIRCTDDEDEQVLSPLVLPSHDSMVATRECILQLPGAEDLYEEEWPCECETRKVRGLHARMWHYMVQEVWIDGGELRSGDALVTDRLACHHDAKTRQALFDAEINHLSLPAKSAAHRSPLDNSFFAVLKVCWRKRMQALREQGKLPTHFARLAAVTYLGADARTRRATRGVLTPVLTQVQSGC